MNFISSTQNLINVLKKLPTLSQKFYASGLQIHIKDINGEDILSFEIQAEDFPPVAKALETTIKNRLLMRKALLKNEIDSIDELEIKLPPTDIEKMLENLLEVLYDQPQEYPEVLGYLNLEVDSVEVFTKNNDYDYREYLNDNIRERLTGCSDDIKFLYLKVGLVL